MFVRTKYGRHNRRYWLAEGFPDLSTPLNPKRYFVNDLVLNRPSILRVDSKPHFYLHQENKKMYVDFPVVTMRYNFGSGEYVSWSASVTTKALRRVGYAI